MQHPEISILLVDDDKAVRQMTAAILKSEGFKVVEANSGEQAFKLFKTNVERIDLLITDVVMPGLFGDQLVFLLQSLKPELKFLLISGNPPTSLEPEIPIIEGRNFLRKPFSIDQLKRVLQAQLETETRS